MTGATITATVGNLSNCTYLTNGQKTLYVLKTGNNQTVLSQVLKGGGPWTLTMSTLQQSTAYKVVILMMNCTSLNSNDTLASTTFNTLAPTPTPIPTPTPTPAHSLVTISTATLSIGSDGVNTLNLTWPAQSNLPNTTDWYYYLRRGSATGTTISSGKFADDSPSLTTAAIALSHKLTPGSAYYVRILPYSNAPWNSQGFKGVTTSTGSACADTDAVDLGKLTGYAHDVTGTFASDDCTIGGKAADVYKFQLSTARTVDFGLTPKTAFLSSGYSSGYSMTVRQTNLAGSSLGTASGLGNLDVDDIDVGANQTYIVEVQRQGIGGGYDYSLNIAYGYVQPPTPTPAPTVTPRAQPNLDLRLVPDPEGRYYRVGQSYRFEFEGTADHGFPASVRSANLSAFSLAVNVPADCPQAGNPVSEVTVPAPADTLHLTACAAGRNSTLTVADGAGQLLARYSLYIGGGVAPAPEPSGGVKGPGGGAPPLRGDLLGLGIVIGAVCTGVGVACDVQLLLNLLSTAAALAVMAFLLSGQRGRASAASIGVAVAFGIVAIMLAHLWVEFPLWVVGGAITAVLAVGAVMFVQKGRQAG